MFSHRVSDDVTVAGGFNPRLIAIRNPRRPQRRLNKIVGFQSSLTRRGIVFLAYRGLKPTATFSTPLTR